MEALFLQLTVYFLNTRIIIRNFAAANLKPMKMENNEKIDAAERCIEEQDVIRFDEGWIKPEDVPTGDTMEDRRRRNHLIRQFYNLWMLRNKDRKVFNNSLNDYIHIKYISVNETAGHASLRYLSTLAVLQLDAILPNAILKDNRPANPKTKNQKGFKRMLIMEYDCPAIGLVRLTVGQKTSDNSKVQYCITAIAVCP